jgi:hypothetical protein
MAINVNNMIVTSQSQPPEAAERTVEQQSMRNFRSDIRRNATPPDVTDADNPHVVVAGKAKKIGKTSAYMLDMLSLDD